MKVCLMYFERVYIYIYQYTKGWACPEQSRLNKLLIRTETDLDPRNEISVAFLSDFLIVCRTLLFARVLFVLLLLFVLFFW